EERGGARLRSLREFFAFVGDLLHVRAEAPVLRDDPLSRLGVHADNAVLRGLGVREFLRLRGCEFVGREAVGNVHAAWLQLAVLVNLALVVEDLKVWPVLAVAQRYRVADADRVDRPRVDL